MNLRRVGAAGWLVLIAACAGPDTEPEPRTSSTPRDPAPGAEEPVVDEPVAEDPVCEAPVAEAPTPAPANPLTDWDSEVGRRGTSNDGAWRIQYRTIPDPIPLNDEFGLELAVFSAEGVHAPDVGVAVDAAMPHHRHGMLQVPTIERRADGTFVAEGLLFHMPGYWELYFDVTVDGVTERTQFVVELD